MKKKMRQLEVKSLRRRRANIQRIYRERRLDLRMKMHKMRNIFGCPNMTGRRWREAQGATQRTRKTVQRRVGQKKKSLWNITCNVVKAAPTSTQRKKTSRKNECTPSSKSLKNRKKHSKRNIAKIGQGREWNDLKDKIDTILLRSA